MTLVMTLLVRDEADIIAANIDYHLLQGVDFIIATDNRSEDATPRILKSYEAKGVLRYILEPADDYDQGRWVTRMARMAYADHGASWVINNDADEFWWPSQGSLRDVFDTVAAGVGILRAQRHNFIVVEGDEPFFERMIYREAQSYNILGQPLPPKVSHRGSAEVKVMQGNHNVVGITPTNIQNGLVEILHYPIRSYAQIENKIAKGGAAYERNPSLPPSMGRTWRMLYDELKFSGNLRRYFAENCPAKGRLQQMLQSGKLVSDTRLLSYLHQHASPSELGVSGSGGI